MALNLDSPDTQSQSLIELFVFSKGKLITNGRRMEVVFNVKTLLRCQGSDSLESGLEGVFLRLFDYYIKQDIEPELTNGDLYVPYSGKFIKGLMVGLVGPLLTRRNSGTVTLGIETMVDELRIYFVFDAPPHAELPAKEYCYMAAFVPIFTAA